MEKHILPGVGVYYPLKASGPRSRHKAVVRGGIDTETNANGEPYLITIHSNDQRNLRAALPVDRTNAGATFLAHLTGCCTQQQGSYLFTAHNLAFDMVGLFYEHHHLLVANHSGSFEFLHGGWKISGMYGTPSFVEMRGPNRQNILIVNSTSWFPFTLKAAADLVCPDLPKLDAPDDLVGSDGRVSPEMLEYAMRDAEISCRLTEALDDRHRMLDISQSYSIANMAQRVFKAGFIGPGGITRQMYHLDDALLSYHGGRNWVDPTYTPAWHSNIAAYDISSAHPFGMSKLPALGVKQAWRYKRLFASNTQEFPPLGVYRVSGEVHPCRWSCLYDHAGQAILSGRVFNTWVSGVELNEALRMGEFTLTPGRVVMGHYYDCDRDPDPRPPFRAYVEHFYALKSTPGIDKIDRHFYKILLNSLYGKTIQSTIVDDYDADGSGVGYHYEAGGLYHPMVASFITANTRAHVHQLEHHTKAFHTSTDGVMATVHTDKFPFAPATGLGSIDLDYTGTVALLRRSLYMVLGPTERWPNKPPSRYYRGQSIIKSVTHGATRLSAADFEDLIVSGKRSYTWTGPNKLRTSTKRGLAPNRFETHLATLDVGRLPEPDLQRI